MNDVSRRPIILCFVAYYLPGYRSGGPVRSISNFVEHFGEELDIRIVTSDRDFLDRKPYNGIVIDDWSRVGKASVFYASRRFFSIPNMAKLLRNTSYDVLYLNSFFDFQFTALPLLIRHLGSSPKVPCVIAPRGEFSSGALALKSQKKSLYLKVLKATSLFRGLHWQASSEFELADICRVMGISIPSVAVAPDLPAPEFQAINNCIANSLPDPLLPLQLVFLSRITPMKNLDFLLRCLSQVGEQIDFTIYGPLEDKVYWDRCQSLIASLPSNVSINYRGEVMPTHVLETLSAYDLFVLPSLGENYGHVVFESLSSGTPVLISDRTPWLSSADCAIRSLPLDKPKQWAVTIDQHARLSANERFEFKKHALNYARKYRLTSDSVVKTRDLFYAALRANGD